MSTLDIPAIVQSFVDANGHSVNSPLHQWIQLRREVVAASLDSHLLPELVNHIIIPYDGNPFWVEQHFPNGITDPWCRYRITLENPADARAFVHVMWRPNLMGFMGCFRVHDKADFDQEFIVDTQGIYDPMRDPRCFRDFLREHYHIFGYGESWTLAAIEFEGRLLPLFPIYPDLQLEIKALLSVFGTILEAYSEVLTANWLD